MLRLSEGSKETSFYMSARQKSNRKIRTGVWNIPYIYKSSFWGKLVLFRYSEFYYRNTKNNNKKLHRNILLGKLFV